MKNNTKILQSFFNAVKKAESLHLANPSNETRDSFLMAVNNLKAVTGQNKFNTFATKEANQVK